MTDTAHLPGPLGPENAAQEPWFRRVVFWSLFTSLCPWVPVPLLDDWLIRTLRRRMVREIAAHRGLALTAKEVDQLAGFSADRRGCCLGVFWLTIKVVLKVLGGLLRKLTIVLAVKDSADAASDTFHEGYLLHRALGGAAAGLPLPSLRWTVDRALRDMDPSASLAVIRATIRNGRGVLRQAARLLGRALRSRPRAEREAALPVDESEQALGSLLDPLTAALGADRAHLAELDAALVAAITTERARMARMARSGALDPTPGNSETPGP